MAENIEAEISKLKGLSLRELRDEWRRLLSDPPPTCKSTDFTRRLLASKLQEKVFGPLTPETSRRLKKLKKTFGRNPARAFTPTLDLKPGTILTREWKGSLQRVYVMSDGFDYEGERFDSLSEVARKITGTRWSGPLFFGLKRSGKNK